MSFTEPSNPFEWIIRGLIIAFIAFMSLGESGPLRPQTAPQPPETGLIRVPHFIESVEVGRYPSVAAYPAPLYITVRATLDGCDYPTQIEQRQEGNTLYVDIFRQMPADVMCPMIAKLYEAEIPLEGTFDQGTYTIIVNNVTVTYEV